MPIQHRYRFLAGLAALLVAGCASTHVPAGKVARVDVGRLHFMRGYEWLHAGHPDSATTEFELGMAQAEEDHTPTAPGGWGLALALRQLGQVARSDSLVARLPAAPGAEPLFAQGWLHELYADTASALLAYQASSRADSAYAAPLVRTARLVAARGELRAAMALLDRAMALGDTLAPRLREALVPPPPPSPEDSLAAAADTSAALTRLQWAMLLHAHGQVRCGARYAPPELTHFRAVRDSLNDMSGTRWAGLVQDAVRLSRLDVFPDGTFHPEDRVSRARFALWLDALDCPVTGAEAPLPADVPAGDYRAGAIARALGAGTLSLRAGGRFEPDSAITGREARFALRRISEGP